MGALARSFLCKASPLFWLAAVSLAITWDATQVPVLGWIVICTGAGTAGTVSGAVSSRSRYDRELLLNALLANRPPGEKDPDPDRCSPGLHRVV